MTRAYLFSMFARLVTMLAVLAIAVIATVTSAHTAGLSPEPNHAVHVSEMMQVVAGSDHSCDGEQHCGSMDAGSCELLCAGISIFLISLREDSASDCAPASHALPTAETVVSRGPGPNERPPKLRLL
ncbi:hypothetical protein [Paracoccus simplex]|uniref:Secreted protein n=1 Tax=Paracoccus simplex TaxID=2086346 RepID=A0ABV7S0F5_9RHOB